MREKLKNFRGQKFVGTTQLADTAARFITEFVPRQERGSVSEVPDERMVRYYNGEGLISPPEGKQGLSAVYGYGHLLQLLVIKRLQAEHLPIRKIKELVESKSERELEQLLGMESESSKKNAATEYLESLLKPRAPATQIPPPPMPAARKASSRVSASVATAQQTPGPTSVNAWSRIEVEPGLELHIRGDYQLPDDVKERQRLARRMLSEIENNGQEPRK
jgi:DNA-binding transcriptional MerR regulator